MKPTSFLRHRPGVTVAKTLVALFLVVVTLAGVGLLLTAIQEVREAAARAQSQHNLKQMGIAIHNWANANNGRFWVGDVAPHDGKGSFFIELLPYLEARSLYRDTGKDGFEYPPFKGYHAPLDYTHVPTQPMLSYGLNSYFVNRGLAGPVSMGGVSDNVAIMPDTFRIRGTHDIIGIAERLANNTRTYHGSDIYFYPPHISVLSPISREFWPTDATAFSRNATQVLLMDGSVNYVVSSRGGYFSGDDSVFDIYCSTNNTTGLGW